VTRAELAAAFREHAFEGDFVLRSGRRSPYYLDKYRFETGPTSSPSSAGGSPTRCMSTSRTRRFEPVLRPVAPRLVVEPGSLTCLVEDVVTSGGAAVNAVEALREAGLQCRTAVCVVDREEGGMDALARPAVRLRPLFRVSELVEATLSPQIRMVEPVRPAC
jgi:orotate phosphoribosyltransferase